MLQILKYDRQVGNELFIEIINQAQLSPGQQKHASEQKLV